MANYLRSSQQDGRISGWWWSNKKTAVSGTRRDSPNAFWVFLGWFVWLSTTGFITVLSSLCLNFFHRINQEHHKINMYSVYPYWSSLPSQNAGSLPPRMFYMFFTSRDLNMCCFPSLPHPTFQLMTHDWPWKALKDQRAEYLWKQLERVIPDIRQRTKASRVEMFVCFPMSA